MPGVYPIGPEGKNFRLPEPADYAKSFCGKASGG